MAPSSISSLALPKAGWLVEIAPQQSGTPASAQAETMASHCSSRSAIGFSVMIPRAPCSTAARVSSGRILVFVETATISGLSRRSISTASV